MHKDEVYFAQTGCKIEGELTDILWAQERCFVLYQSERWGPTFTSGLLINFAAKRKNGGIHSHGAAISFFPHIDFILMNVYMNTGIK